jgi:hypothetical protein
MRIDVPRYARPEPVDLCYRAACDGDLDAVKEHVWQLLHNPEFSSGEPRPAWLFASLSEAIRQKNIKMVQFLLDENVSDGDLPIENAVRGRAFEILELFLRYGWDINQPMGRNEPSALRYYLQSLLMSLLLTYMFSIPLCTSDDEMVLWLLDHGADPNSRCDWDFTPTSYAMYAASLKTIECLFQRGANPLYGQLLHHAVLREKPDALDLVRQIVERGAPINEIKYEQDAKTYIEREPFGLGTPLHRAAEFGKVDIVRYLLEMGADSLILDSKGRTPRFWAEQKGYAEVVSVLKEAENRQLQRANIDSMNP